MNLETGSSYGSRWNSNSNRINIIIIIRLVSSYPSGGEVSLPANWKLILFIGKNHRHLLLLRLPDYHEISIDRGVKLANNVPQIRNDCAASFTYRARFKSSTRLSFIYSPLVGMLIIPHSRLIDNYAPQRGLSPISRSINYPVDCS